MSLDPTMYLIANKGLNMTPGKLAAQVAHAAVEAYRITPQDSNLLRLWYRGGHYKKIVLEARDESHLEKVYAYLMEREINCALIIDEGRTEIPAHSLTAIGCEIVDKSHPHTKACFEGLELYKDTTFTLPEESDQTTLKFTVPPVEFSKHFQGLEDIYAT